MPVVNVWVVRVLMHQHLVPMGMDVRLPALPGKVVHVLVVCVSGSCVWTWELQRRGQNVTRAPPDWDQSRPPDWRWTFSREWVQRTPEGHRLSVRSDDADRTLHGRSGGSHVPLMPFGTSR